MPEFQSATAAAISAVTGLCERSLEARRLAREFFDSSPCVGRFEIDVVATAGAGQEIFVDKPSDGLLRLLAALRALERHGDPLGDGCVTDGHSLRSLVGVATPG